MARSPSSGLAPIPTTSPPRPIGFHLTRNGSSLPVNRDVSLLFFEVLSQSPEAGAYYLGRRLAELFPDRTLVETAQHDFDVESYAGAGHCTVTERHVPAGQRLTWWSESDERMGHPARHVWLEVQWGNERLDVVIMCRDRMKHGVILADDHATADRFLAAVCRWNTRPREETIMVFGGHTWFFDEHLCAAIKATTLDTLVVRPGLKEELLRDVVSFFEARETYQRYGVAWRRGILLLGSPGNGKTHAVKALVNAVDRPCLYVRSFRSRREPDEINMETVFARARTAAPCILVLEDLDALVTDENRSYFLNELDGFEGNEGVLTLATTNHPERLDPAIIHRPSRFDRKYTFDLPQREERAAYIASWNDRLEPALRLSPAGVGHVADATDGFSFAYLKELFVGSSVRWMAQQESGSMERIAREQAAALRTEMAQMPMAGHEDREQVTGARRNGRCRYVPRQGGE